MRGESMPTHPRVPFLVGIAARRGTEMHRLEIETSRDREPISGRTEIRRYDGCGIRKQKQRKVTDTA